VDQLTQLALRLRPELKQLAAEIRGLEYGARSRRARDLPQLDLLGEYDFRENRFASPQGIAAVGVGVSWNVFDGGRDRHQAAALISEAERLRNLLADLQSLVALEIRQRWLDSHETHKRLAVTSQALRQADENLRVTRQRYLSALATNSRVLEAEALRSQAYGNHYNATYDAAFAVIRLRGATGELQD
jgi:outer membrane protein TolC